MVVGTERVIICYDSHQNQVHEESPKRDMDLEAKLVTVSVQSLPSGSSYFSEADV